MSDGSLYAHVVDAVGQRIIDGDVPVGGILLADELCELYGVSRPVVREAIRTLGSMGLVQSRRHAGTRVLPTTNWDLLNPHVVRWRGRGRGYLLQMRHLLELRLGLEPAAAGLAARRVSSEQAARLLQCSEEMQAAFAEGDQHLFFELDVAFHRMLLEGTANGIITQLANTIDVTLAARGEDDRPGMQTLSVESLARHRQLAEAIARGDADTAEKTARALVAHTLAEFEQLDDTIGSDASDAISAASSSPT